MDYITRNEFEQLKEQVKRIEQKTEEIKVTRIEVASKDVLDRLDALKEEMHTISNTWLNTLQEHYTEHKDAISEVKTVQSGHSKFFEEHGKRLAATATKDDVSSRFDKLEATQAEHSQVSREHGQRLDTIDSKLDQQGQLLREILARLPKQGE